MLHFLIVVCGGVEVEVDSCLIDKAGISVKPACEETRADEIEKSSSSPKFLSIRSKV